MGKELKNIVMIISKRKMNILKQSTIKLKENRRKDNLPIKIIKPLCIWKERKSDKNMPSKQNELMHCWNEKKYCKDCKDCKDLSLEKII